MKVLGKSLSGDRVLELEKLNDDMLLLREKFEDGERHEIRIDLEEIRTLYKEVFGD